MIDISEDYIYSIRHFTIGTHYASQYLLYNYAVAVWFKILVHYFFLINLCKVTTLFNHVYSHLIIQ